MENEIWKNVEDYPGYEVSNIGRVRKTTAFPRMGIRVKILRPQNIMNGYLVVRLFKSREEIHNKAIHRLVAMAFVDGFKEGLEVNHKDGNRQNSAWTNLEWVTPSDNQKQSWAMQKEKASRRSFSDDEVMKMRQCRDIGLTLNQICRAFNMTSDYAYKIISGQRRKL